MPRKPTAPTFKEHLENVEINVGKTAIIDCVLIEGEPEADIDWYFEGKLIKDAGRFRYLFEKNDVVGLEIRKVTVEDEGEYKVVAQNDSGKVASTCEVLVNDPDKKKKSDKEPETKSSASFHKEAAGRVFTPRKKKKKLPIDRPGIKAENPEKYYTFGDEIGRGKFSVVRKCIDKKTGTQFAAKIIKFDEDSLKFAIREYDLMTGGRLNNRGLVMLHEAYLVRKYLILVMDLIEGKTFLDHVSHKHTLTEEDCAGYIKQLCEVLNDMHSQNVIHNDIRPTNIRFVSGREFKLLDYNSARQIANKKAGEVVDVIGDTEFCAPELLEFDPVLPGSDMWSVGVILYIMLSGISPFYYDDEDKVVDCVKSVTWSFDDDAFSGITSSAKDFIKKLFFRQPEKRLTASKALEHKWLSADYKAMRVKSKIPQEALERMIITDERLLSEEVEDYVEASLTFRTFDEEEYQSPSEDEEEDEE